MKKPQQIEQALGVILEQYQQSFTSKIYIEETDISDLLMEVFGITAEIKRENRQYWGRELGMCRQRLVTQLCRVCCGEFATALRLGSDSLAIRLWGNWRLTPNIALALAIPAR